MNVQLSDLCFSFTDTDGLRTACDFLGKSFWNQGVAASLRVHESGERCQMGQASAWKPETTERTARAISRETSSTSCMVQAAEIPSNKHTVLGSAYKTYYNLMCEYDEYEPNCSSAFVIRVVLIVSSDSSTNKNYPKKVQST